MPRPPNLNLRSLLFSRPLSPPLVPIVLSRPFCLDPYVTVYYYYYVIILFSSSNLS